jgi:Metallo-beta-lactamase superfamily
MSHRIERIEGRVMAVNSFLVHGPEGVVVIDRMLTVSDAALVRQAIDDAGLPLAGVVVTHPHPDHYAGLAQVIGTNDVAVVATSAVDAVIRRDDQLNNDVVGPMMGDEWPSTRLFPNLTVDYGRRPPGWPDAVGPRARTGRVARRQPVAARRAHGVRRRRRLQRDARLPRRWALAGVARQPGSPGGGATG